MLAIDVRYEAKGARSTRVVAGLLHKLRDRLWAVDEQRFPFIGTISSSSKRLSAFRDGQR
ncbi:MAG: hypothetical protein R3D25_04430 [Geminicoccaceae bacterium]